MMPVHYIREQFAITAILTHKTAGLMVFKLVMIFAKT